MVSSPGRNGAAKRTVSSAQYAKRRVGTAQAQTMISSNTVAMIPPWMVFLKPICSARGTKLARTIVPSVSNRRFRPAVFDSPQTKHEWVWVNSRINSIGGGGPVEGKGNL